MYAPRPLAFDPSSVDGLSYRLITSHHENNYGGAVRRLNAIRAECASLDWASTPGFTANGLRREELIAANSGISPRSADDDRRSTADGACRGEFVRVGKSDKFTVCIYKKERV